MWKKIYASKNEEEWLKKTYRKKARFLLDENVPRGIFNSLLKYGFNTKSAAQLNLNHKSDQLVFQHARKRQRMLITHDTDFLNISEFPLRLSPGVIILKCKDSSEQLIKNTLHTVVTIIAPFSEIWRKSVIEVNADTMSVTSLSNYGSIHTSRYRFLPNQPAEIWVEVDGE
jgi:predicted nuclease of predicted toxin-antitoxin system